MTLSLGPVRAKPNATPIRVIRGDKNNDRCDSKSRTEKVIELLEALEASGFAMWVKESSTAYVAVLAFHTIGLTFLVGISGATAMRILGVARSMPLAPMEDFFPLMYVGFWINAATGTVLLSLYPTKFFVDATLYIKLGAITVAIIMIRKLQAYVFGSPNLAKAAESRKAKLMAGTLLAVWLVAITAGRVMAYTLPTKLQTAGAVLVVAALALLIGYFARHILGLIKSSANRGVRTPVSLQK